MGEFSRFGNSTKQPYGKNFTGMCQLHSSFYTIPLSAITFFGIYIPQANKPRSGPIKYSILNTKIICMVYLQNVVLPNMAIAAVPNIVTCILHYVLLFVYDYGIV